MPSKRGAHLALVARATGSPVRASTPAGGAVRHPAPTRWVARFWAGWGERGGEPDAAAPSGGEEGEDAETDETIVRAELSASRGGVVGPASSGDHRRRRQTKALELRIEVSVEDMAGLGSRSYVPPARPPRVPPAPRSGPPSTPAWSSWPGRPLDSHLRHSRRVAERLATAMNELAGEVWPTPPRLGGAGPAAQIEDRLKTWTRLPGGHLVAGARHRHGRDRLVIPDRVAAPSVASGSSASAGPGPGGAPSHG